MHLIYIFLYFIINVRSNSFSTFYQFCFLYNSQVHHTPVTSSTTGGSSAWTIQHCNTLNTQTWQSHARRWTSHTCTPLYSKTHKRSTFHKRVLRLTTVCQTCTFRFARVRIFCRHDVATVRAQMTCCGQFSQHQCTDQLACECDFGFIKVMMRSRLVKNWDIWTLSDLLCKDPFLTWHSSS